jgi:hypothetical protein
MATSELILALEKRIRALGYDNPIYIGDTIRSVLNGDENLSIIEAMDRFEAFFEEASHNELLLKTESFPDLKYEGIILKEFKAHPEFQSIANMLKDQFSSRGKGFGKMVPRPIDFAGFAKLSEEKIDKKTVFFTLLFWTAIYSIILYFI